VPSIVARHDASGPQAFNWPFFLPGGKAVLFDIVSKSDQINAQLAAVRLSDGKVTPLGLTGRNPRYVTTGHIVFGRIGGTVAAVPFDASTLRVTGTAVTVLQGVFIRGGGATQIGVARNGTLFFVEGNPDVELSIMDQAGGTRSLGLAARNYNWPHFSPTSGRIVFQMADRGSFTKTDIWVYNDLTRTVSRLTNDGNSTYPFWMGDGERVVWITRDSAGTHVRRQRWDGTGTPETLFSGDSSIMYVVPAPSGSHWGVVRRGGFSDLYMAEGDPPSSPHALVTTREGEGGPRISPDGRWVAYYGDETGQTEVYVIAANGDGGRHQISIDGGGEPVWAPDGRTLYYRAGGNLVAAAITTSLAFSVTKREPMFADRFRSTGNIAEYDVSRDGRSFVVMGNVGRANERIVVVTGWLDELREQMAQAARK
jgi:Tol biopolymer transport system component